jgi:membrane protein YdbS with pleckstrin-like domain
MDERRISFALILLALAIPSLFAWSDNVALESASQFTSKLVAVTLLALVARLWKHAITPHAYRFKCCWYSHSCCLAGRAMYHGLSTKRAWP